MHRTHMFKIGRRSQSLPIAGRSFRDESRRQLDRHDGRLFITVPVLRRVEQVIQRVRSILTTGQRS